VQAGCRWKQPAHLTLGRLSSSAFKQALKLRCKKYSVPGKITHQSASRRCMSKSVKAIGTKSNDIYSGDYCGVFYPTD
jgi:hypothetical protein